LSARPLLRPRDSCRTCSRRIPPSKKPHVPYIATKWHRLNPGLWAPREFIFSCGGTPDKSVFARGTWRVGKGRTKSWRPGRRLVANCYCSGAHPSTDWCSPGGTNSRLFRLQEEPEPLITPSSQRSQGANSEKWGEDGGLWYAFVVQFWRCLPARFDYKVGELGEHRLEHGTSDGQSLSSTTGYSVCRIERSVQHDYIIDISK